VPVLWRHPSQPPFPPKAIKAADRLAPLLVDGRPPRLLLVEDNATNALLGKALLEHLGCTARSSLIAPRP
jgi:hypothetical protein